MIIKPDKTDKFKKPREPAVEIMFVELKKLLKTTIICNIIVILAGVGYYTLFTELTEFTTATLLMFFGGLLLGNVASLGNFCFLGFKAARIIRSKNSRYAQIYSTGSFFIRYFGAFVLFGVLIRLNLINPITVVVPLFYPKIHYTIEAIFIKPPEIDVKKLKVIKDEKNVLESNAEFDENP
ncbi:MAG: hypothetical protein FWF76_05805 [Oscillospiraceae bacterium]|nr:hypothetical protein [Oscillospiraceae bacterium]